MNNRQNTKPELAELMISSDFDEMENIEYITYEIDDENDEKVNIIDEEEQNSDDKIINWLGVEDQKENEEHLEKENFVDVKIKNDSSNDKIEEEYLNDEPQEEEEVVVENDNIESTLASNDESTSEDLYHCSTCDVNFHIIGEHIEKYHKNEIIDIDDTAETDNNRVNEQNSVIVYDDDNLNVDFDLDRTSPSRFVIIEKEKLNEIEIKKFTEICNENEIVEEENDERRAQTDDDDDNVGHFCLQCDTIFNSIEDVNKHVCEQTEESSIAIKPEPEQNKRTKTQRKKNESIVCNECGVSFHSNRSLALHKRVHKQLSNVKNKKTLNTEKTKDDEIIQEFHCEICNTKFLTLKSLKLHSKMHNSSTTSKSFDRILASERKIIEKSGHLSDENFWCEICGKSYNKVFQDVHEKSHENELKIICSICNKKFDNDTECTIHMKLHENHPKRRGITKAESAGITLPYACSYCGREFKKPHEKVKHERIHTGEKPFKCDICGKCFRVAYCLTLHIRTHTNARPYVCPVCNKRFKSVSVYTHHLASHSDERAYKCPYCPKTFKTAVALAGHRKSHTKPFTCTECNRPFASLYAVKAHMETHKKSNTNLKHSCIICGAYYAKIFALRDHMKEQHSDVIISESDIITATTTTAKKGESGINDENIITEDLITSDSAQNIEESVFGDKDEITIAVVENFHTEEIVADDLWLKEKL